MDELSFIELVQIYFEENYDPDEISFEKWLADLGYVEGMTDPQIYSILPDVIKERMYDDVMNLSWWHAGM